MGAAAAGFAGPGVSLSALPVARQHAFESNALAAACISMFLNAGSSSFHSSLLGGISADLIADSRFIEAS
jgi:hypothetical protein